MVYIKLKETIDQHDILDDPHGYDDALYHMLQSYKYTGIKGSKQEAQVGLHIAQGDKWPTWYYRWSSRLQWHIVPHAAIIEIYRYKGK